MTGDNEILYGQSQEVIVGVINNNTSQTLYRHYYTNNHGNFDHDAADLILKKGDYANTYISIQVTGIPNDVVLNLTDENNNQLYSPVDANGNWITTQCSIIVGESNIIPLPAQFNNQLSSHVPFSAGTYNWKLIFSGNSNYEAEEILFTVEIRDFKVWDIITPEIFPNENVKAKIKTYADTYYPNNYFDNNLLTTNATYDASTGIITYPNQDISDLTIGKHMQIINQVSNCFIDYEVKNPIEFYYAGNNEYGSNRNIGYIVKTKSLVSDVISSRANIIINGIDIPWDNYAGGTSPDTVYKVYRNKNYFPPGTYHCIVTPPVSIFANQQQYTCEGDFEVSTENCSLSLINNNSQLQSTYLYNNTTPIPNAKLGLKNVNTNILVETQVTDSNGQINWNTNTLGEYVCVAIDYDNTHILSSDICYVDGISINDLLLGTTLVNNITVTDGEIIYDNFTVDSNTTMNNLNNVLTNITYSNGYLNVTAYTTNATRNYFVDQTEAEIINDFITNINYSNGTITYTQFGDDNE